MPKQPTAPNRLKEYHEFLKHNDPGMFNYSVLQICEDLGISASSFYRKMINPAHSFSNADKEAICKVYQLPLHFIFPEMELSKNNANNDKHRSKVHS